MKKETGFTLIEVMIVVCILAILVTLALRGFKVIGDTNPDGTGTTWSPSQGTITTTCENGKLVRSSERTVVIMGDCK